MELFALHQEAMNSEVQHQKNKENEDHIVWSGLGLQTGYHYLIDVYMNGGYRLEVISKTGLS